MSPALAYRFFSEMTLRCSFSCRSNKKLFELFTIHLMLQEIQRTTHPEHAFLCINLNSTLFNLGLTKCNSLATSTNP